MSWTKADLAAINRAIRDAKRGSSLFSAREVPNMEFALSGDRIRVEVKKIISGAVDLRLSVLKGGVELVWRDAPTMLRPGESFMLNKGIAITVTGSISDA